MFKRRVSKLDIPIKLFLLVEGDEELMELVRMGLPYPYDVRKELPRMLREVADDLEEMSDEPRGH